METADFYALDPDAVLDAVERTGRTVSGHLLALNSYENRVYRVGIEGADPVVAKFYRPGRWPDTTIVEEHDYTLELEQAEVPVVAPLADAQGHTLLRHGKYRYALYPCVGGRAPALDDLGQLEDLGRLVGRVHAVGGVRPYRHRPAIDVARLGEASVALLADDPLFPDSLRASYRAAAGGVLERVRARFAAVGTTRSLRLHGDCHPGNLLRRDDAVWLLDFDDSATGPSIQDLWMFLAGERAEMEAGLAALLRGYLEFADFDPREIVLIEPLRALRMLHYAAWLARRWADPAFARAFPWFGTERYFGEHILALHEQAAVLDEPPITWL
ncbi:MAG: serine/threonine protein kinase [Gammaproteobacteria bacterium]|nr:serine/threonine protein kinase [Gammaproteobacteria bacterium]